MTAVTRSAASSALPRVLLAGGPINVADVEVEQEPGRPFAYVSRARYGETGVIGFDVTDLSAPARAATSSTTSPTSTPRDRWSRWWGSPG